MAIQLFDDKKPQTPLERLVDDYLLHCQARGLSPRTLDNSYSYSLREVLLRWCEAEGIARVEDLDRRAFDRFTLSLLARKHPDGRPISKHTVAAYVRPVRLMLTWATREGEAVKAKPQIPRLSKPLRDVLTREEIDLLENAASTERDKLIVRLFSDCGLRLIELTELAPESLNRSGRHAYLRVLGKRNRVRDVPIPPQLLRRLGRHIDGRPVDRSTDRVFLSLRRGRTGEYDAMTPHGVHQVVKDAAKRVGLKKPVYPHLLRHSWMTEMIRNGMSPIQLSVIAGASMQVIADHYTHLTKDDAHDAMIRVLLNAGRRPR
jgi:integrase